MFCWRKDVGSARVLSRSNDMSDDAFWHCEDLVRAHDKDRYLASLFAPADRRRYLLALYAFDLETARVKYLVNEPMAGTIRLQWWSEALLGLRPGEAAAHPVMSALFETSRATGVNLAALAAVVEARQDELTGASPATAAAIIFSFAARLLGASGDVVVAVVNDAGRATAQIDSDPEQARAAYREFRARVKTLPEAVLPAFLPVALVPLRLRQPAPSQWRRQIALARAAWFGFPKL
jgi:phytoene/squalene synthetase